jgi:hypothetical protein
MQIFPDKIILKRNLPFFSSMQKQEPFSKIKKISITTSMDSTVSEFDNTTRVKTKQKPI